MSTSILYVCLAVSIVCIAAVFYSKSKKKAEHDKENNIYNVFDGSAGGNVTRGKKAGVSDIPEEELAAVLMAAVASMSPSTPGYRLQVKSFTRVSPTAPGWNLLGRKEQISNKL